MSGYDLTDCPDLTPYAGDYRPDHPSTLNPELLRDDLLTAVREAIDNHPRSQQKEIGPSEIGHPCNRWLAHKFADTPPTGLQRTPWRPTVGTAVHTEFSDMLHAWNARHGFRWLTDIRVWIGDLYPGRPITGHFDALDTWTRTGIDLKVPGPNSMKTYGPGKPENPQYDVQFDSYGNGIVEGGLPIRYVGSLRLPAAGELADAVWKVRPHDPERARRALSRAGGIAQLVDTLGPAAIAMQPATEHYCGTCPWYRADTTDLTTSCPGAATFIEQRDRKAATPPAALTDLAGPAAQVTPPAPAARPSTTPPASLTELAGIH